MELLNTTPKIFLLLLLLALLENPIQANRGPHKVFTIGEPVEIECKDPTTGAWGPAPTCRETGLPLRFLFGMEAFFHCTLEVDTVFYAFLQTASQQKASWSCRVPMTHDRHNFLPFSLPVWGVAEPTHTHIIPHFNFLFHVHDGFILGASAYPVRDQPEIVVPGGQLGLHGPVKWFQGHTFVPVSPNQPSPSAQPQKQGQPQHQHQQEQQQQQQPKQHQPSAAEPQIRSSKETTTMQYILYSLAAFSVSILVAVLLYTQILKPRLIRKHLKQD